MVSGHANESTLRALSKDELQKVCVNLGMGAAEVSNLLNEFGNTEAFLDYVFSRGKDKGGLGLAVMTEYKNCVLAEYVWLDAHQVPRSKTMTMTSVPKTIADLRIWNYDGSSTEQAEGHNSEVLLYPRAIFNDPFRGAPHVLVVSDVWNAWDGQPSIGNTRERCAQIMEKYKAHDPWFGIEQEYTLMRPGKVGEPSDMPIGFNADGSEPAPQGPYYCSAGTGNAIGREVAEEHYMACIKAGVKIAGTNAEVMPGQWEYQVGPCRGIEMGDHLTVARYIMLRITEKHNVICSISPKPRDGDWNGAGCHTNFSTEGMRAPGGYSDIIKVCEAFGPVAAEHIAVYGEGNDKRLTGKHETCSINQFKYGVANRGASIRIPRDAEKNGCGYMEDRRPAANCDPYAVTWKIMETAGAALGPPPAPPAVKDGLPYLESYENCVLAEYVWLDAALTPRSKTMTMPKLPNSIADLRIWNYDGSSTEQAEGHNSEIFIHPRAMFKDPFRGAPHILVMCDAMNAWDNKPSIGNTRAMCAEVMEKYKQHDPWFGIEQEYTLMKPGKVGEVPTEPYGFNADGSEPAPQGPYYCSAGTGAAIGRAVADEHYAKCVAAGVKIAGTNAEVMPGQWEYQVGPCRGIQMGDHLFMARYIMLRVTEKYNVICSISPKPREGDWNGAGCHTNFSTVGMRAPGGYAEIIKVCEAFGPVAAQHIALYGEGNDKRLTGKHETCSINQFKYGVANRGASIRIPRDAEKEGRGYMEDRRPAANCDPYAVTYIIMKTTGEALSK